MLGVGFLFLGRWLRKELTESFAVWTDEAELRPTQTLRPVSLGSLRVFASVPVNVRVVTSCVALVCK